jgi:hypothetical protein
MIESRGLKPAQSGFAIPNPRFSVLRAEAITLEFAMFHLRYTAARAWTSALAIAVIVLGMAGCGGPRLYPVHGKVTWENGAEARELVGGLVICESVDGGVGARGDIEKDGSFRLSTYKPGDGLLPGKHRVGVVEYSPREPPPPPIIDRTFSSVEASGLEINVERKTNDVTLKVRRAHPQPRR